MNWYKGSLKLSDGERHSVVSMGNRHLLDIAPVDAADFGNYSCVSENALGTLRGEATRVTLTGEDGADNLTYFGGNLFIFPHSFISVSKKKCRKFLDLFFWEKRWLRAGEEKWRQETFHEGRRRPPPLHALVGNYAPGNKKFPSSFLSSSDRVCVETAGRR